MGLSLVLASTPGVASSGGEYSPPLSFVYFSSFDRGGTWCQIVVKEDIPEPLRVFKVLPSPSSPLYSSSGNRSTSHTLPKHAQLIQATNTQQVYCQHTTQTFPTRPNLEQVYCQHTTQTFPTRIQISNRSSVYFQLSKQSHLIQISNWSTSNTI